MRDLSTWTFEQICSEKFTCMKKLNRTVVRGSLTQKDEQNCHDRFIYMDI